MTPHADTQCNSMAQAKDEVRPFRSNFHEDNRADPEEMKGSFDTLDSSTKEAYETKAIKLARADATANAATGEVSITPAAGDSLLHTGHGSVDRPWYVGKVTAHFPEDQNVNFHYYNARRKAKLLLVGHQPVRSKPDKPEVQEMLQPDEYTADIQRDSLDHFCQTKIPVTNQVKTGAPDELRICTW